jgi:hypothetical protein
MVALIELAVPTNRLPGAPMRNSAMTALMGFDVWFMDGVDFAAWPIQP